MARNKFQIVSIIFTILVIISGIGAAGYGISNAIINYKQGTDWEKQNRSTLLEMRQKYLDLWNKAKDKNDYYVTYKTKECMEQIDNHLNDNYFLRNNSLDQDAFDILKEYYDSLERLFNEYITEYKGQVEQVLSVSNSLEVWANKQSGPIKKALHNSKVWSKIVNIKQESEFLPTKTIAIYWKWFYQLPSILNSYTQTNPTLSANFYSYLFQNILTLCNEKYYTSWEWENNKLNSLAQEMETKVYLADNKDLVLDQLDNFLQTALDYLELYNQGKREIEGLKRYAAEMSRKQTSINNFMKMDLFKAQYGSEIEKHKEMAQINLNQPFKQIQQQYLDFFHFIDPILKKGFLAIGFGTEQYQPFKNLRSQFYSYLKTLANSDLYAQARVHAQTIIDKYSNEFANSQNNSSKLEELLVQYQQAYNDFVQKFTAVNEATK
ncbi:hypothetical protein [Mycoplasma sp. Z473B]|uniref:hypothetical protein n=1 Tax=Mycoplasma sp. Z473B TaxID=3401667 RepID=UPI003AADE105